MQHYSFTTVEDCAAIEAQAPWADRLTEHSMAAYLARTARRHGARPAISFQLTADRNAPAETLTWAELEGQAIRLANVLHNIGIGPTDRVAYLLPNCNEAVIAFLAGTMAGIVTPINPLLEPDHIAALLRETGAKALITLKAFPKTDLSQKAGLAVAQAPCVRTVLEVDLARYLPKPKRALVHLIRPRPKCQHHARVMNLHREMARSNGEALAFDDPQKDRIAACFHTGGTTGAPKLAYHQISGMIYNGWLGGSLLFDEQDVMICPLPMFHVFAAYPVLMSAIASGAHVVFPTPSGYRGAGVMDNFWQLIERWKVSFMITVPTALSGLMQRPVDADISSLRIAISGSAPMSRDLYHRFHKATGVEVAEGYGLTEATCLVAVNPPVGEKRLGSVGLPLPYCKVQILTRDDNPPRPCATDEVGEICVSSPGLSPASPYSTASDDPAIFDAAPYLPTGDLGRLDAQGYLWITGRAKDVIIRGGHNIDPGVIEDPLMQHPQVAQAAAIGQPDPVSGEMPCVYVELCEGATVSEAELLAVLKANINERAALPKYLEIIDELPKTGVGKVFKPALRQRAIARVLSQTLADAGVEASVHEVTNDRKRGFLAVITCHGPCNEAALHQCLDTFSVPWTLQTQEAPAPSDP